VQAPPDPIQGAPNLVEQRAGPAANRAGSISGSRNGSSGIKKGTLEAPGACVRKRRWLSLPEGGKICFDARASGDFPEGTVFVKDFALAPDESRPTKCATSTSGGRQPRW